MGTIKPEDLQRLVATAVEQALKQRKLSEADLNKLLHEPITIGLLAEPYALSASAEGHQIAPALPGIHEKPRLIGFVAPNLDQAQAKLKVK